MYLCTSKASKQSTCVSVGYPHVAHMPIAGEKLRVVSLHLHTRAYVSIRQHTRVRIVRLRAFTPSTSAIEDLHVRSYSLIRQHTSAHVSIRQHTSAYVSIRKHFLFTSAIVDTHVRACSLKRQHTAAHVSIRQHTSAYVSTQHFFHLCHCRHPRALMQLV